MKCWTFALSSLTLLVASVPAASPSAAQSVPMETTSALRAGFAQPPQAAKLRCYWWWLNGNTTADTITHDLEAMKSHGYAGAILVDADGSGQDGNREVPTGPAIGSSPWIVLFLHALDVAQRLGLEISLNITSRWDVGIIGGATVTPEDAMKLLTYSRTVVEGGGERRVRLAAPPAENGFYRPIATLAYPLRHGEPLAGAPASGRTRILDLPFKTASEETGFSTPPASRVLRNAPAVAGEQDADVKDVVDVSSHVSAEGILAWTFPTGRWEVLRIGYTDTHKQLIDADGKPMGLPLDAMSAEAFDDYWRQAVMPLLDAAKPYLGKSLRSLVTDSWEAGGTNWTEGFREAFERRRGYDPVPYLPVVAGRILTSRDTSDRFLFDLRRTVADLIAENYYDRFASTARQFGLEVHPEAGGPHGAPIDALRNFRDSAFPQTEFWAASGFHRVTDGERFFVKEASSAAHIYGKRFVAAEGLTSMNPAAWSESPGRNLQPTFDHALTEGLNRLFWHEFTSSPAEYGKPGQEYFAGTHLSPNVTWWGQAGPLLLAFNRAQFLMQQGQPVADILYFYGDQVPDFVRVKSDDPARVLPGYDYDVTDEDALLHRMQFNGSDLHTPEGLRYRALVLPASRDLSYPALMWMRGFVRQGGIVIGLKPTGPLGILSAEKNAEYADVVRELWGSCDSGSLMPVHYGLGMIYCMADAHKALGAMGAAPDFAYQASSDSAGADPHSSFDFIHRRTDDAEIYFVRNTRDQAAKATLSFRVNGRAPELWMPDDGSITPALVYRQASGGRTEVPLSFPANGSVFLIFERPAARHLVDLERNGSEVFPSIRPGVGTFTTDDAAYVATEPGAYGATDSDGDRKSFQVEAQKPETGLGPWTLSFPSGLGAPSSIPVEHFASWTESTDAGVRYFSGTATYHTTLRVSESDVEPGRAIWMNLGDVREIASVLVNGIPVQTLWRAPFVTRIDRQLHAGDNTIDVQVSNLWPNRIIGDLQPSAIVHYTQTNIRAYTKDSPLLPSGLLAPVRVESSTVHDLP